MADNQLPELVAAILRVVADWMEGQGPEAREQLAKALGTKSKAAKKAAPSSPPTPPVPDNVLTLDQLTQGIASAPTVEALTSLVPYIQKLSVAEKDILRKLYQERAAQLAQEAARAK